MNFLYVFIGGGIGSMVRYSLGILIKKNPEQISLPYATLLANILASIVFAIAFRSLVNMENSNWRWFILSGVCGGLSTFSTFSFETFELIKSGNWIWAVANILLSIILCLLPFFIFLRFNES